MLTERMNYTGENLRVRDDVINNLVAKENTPFTKESLSAKFTEPFANRWWDEIASQAK